MSKNILAVGITILFLGLAFAPLTQGITTKESEQPISNGNTLYVGGTGSGNYTSIQDAIGDASNGDTVFVYDDSSPYYENIIVDKSINLIGENRYTTIIDGMNNTNVVEIIMNRVDLSGFTIQNCGDNLAGISILSSNNIIHNCRVIYNKHGIEISDSRKNKIINCNVENNSGIGIMISKVLNCQIIGNIIANNGMDGISKGGDTFIIMIKENIIKNNGETGIYLGSSYIGFGSIVTRNTIRGNAYIGILIRMSNGAIITHNNFIDNGESNFRHAEFGWCFWQYWNKNYWNPRPNQPTNNSSPYIIPKWDIDTWRLPLVNFDWHPAEEPYDIEV